MSQKLQGILVCEQLWIFYSKINFEVIYLTQFSIFLKKSKIEGCRLFITTLRPLGLSFFNSIINLTILCFEPFFTSFYLITIFFYMLYNSKLSKFFQACSQLALKIESKE